MSPKSRRSILVLLALPLLAMLGLRQANDWRLTERLIGVTLESTRERVAIADVTPDLPAERAGLEVGDEVIQIGELRLRTAADYDRAAAHFVRGRAVDFHVLREGRETVLRVEPGAPFPWLQSAFKALACGAFAILAGMAFLQTWTEPRGKLLFVYAAAIAVELALPLSLVQFPRYEVFAFPFLSLLVGLQIGLELHLASSIPRPQPWLQRKPWATLVFYALGLGLGGLHALSLFDYFFEWDLLPWSMAQADFLFWEVGMALWALAVLVLLARPALGWPEPLGRQQASLVLVGVLPWAALIGVRVTMETLFGQSVYWIDLVDPFVLFFYPLAIFVAIFRYRLFDLELVVKRSLVYAMLAGALVVVAYGAMLVLGIALSGWLPPAGSSRWSLAAAALLLGLLFDPLRKASRALIERRFFPERRALRAELVRLAGELPAQGNVAAMGHALVSRLCEVFGASWAAVLLAERQSRLLMPVEARGIDEQALETLPITATDPGIELLRSGRRPLEVERVGVESERLRRRLEQLGGELLVPLLRKDQLIGLVILAAKAYREPYRSEEKELISLLSHHVASVFENAQLFESATRDSLTGLLRREAVLERLERELERADRFDRPLTIGMADIDHFKEINDRHGHPIGDLMLKQVAYAMMKGLRKSDVVGRYGGEEFVLLLTETGLGGALTVAEKMREAVESVEIEAPTGKARVTLSIGLASRSELLEGVPSDAATLIDLADRALYAAKRGGRNRVDSYRGLAG